MLRTHYLISGNYEKQQKIRTHTVCVHWFCGVWPPVDAFGADERTKTQLNMRRRMCDNRRPERRHLPCGRIALSLFFRFDQRAAAAGWNQSQANIHRTSIYRMHRTCPKMCNSHIHTYNVSHCVSTAKRMTNPAIIFCCRLRTIKRFLMFAEISS